MVRVHVGTHIYGSTAQMVDGHQTVNLTHKKLNRFESFYSHLIMGIGQAWLHCGGLKILRAKFDSLSTHNTTLRDDVLVNHITVNVIKLP